MYKMKKKWNRGRDVRRGERQEREGGEGRERGGRKERDGVLKFMFNIISKNCPKYNVF